MIKQWEVVGTREQEVILEGTQRWLVGNIDEIIATCSSKPAADRIALALNYYDAIVRRKESA